MAGCLLVMEQQLMAEISQHLPDGLAQHFVDIHDSQRMYTYNFGDPLTFSLEPP